VACLAVRQCLRTRPFGPMLSADAESTIAYESRIWRALRTRAVAVSRSGRMKTTRPPCQSRRRPCVALGARAHLNGFLDGDAVDAKLGHDPRSALLTGRIFCCRHLTTESDELRSGIDFGILDCLSESVRRPNRDARRVTMTKPDAGGVDGQGGALVVASAAPTAAGPPRRRSPCR